MDAICFVCGEMKLLHYKTADKKPVCRDCFLSGFNEAACFKCGKRRMVALYVEEDAPICYECFYASPDLSKRRSFVPAAPALIQVPRVFRKTSHMPERSSPVPALAEASEILPVSALIQASRPSPVIPYVSERSSSVPALAEAPKFPHTIALPVLRRKRVQRVNTVAKSEETPEELRKIQEAIRENVESQLKLLGAELSINFHRENLGKAVTTVARLIYTRNNRRNEEDALLAVYAASMIVLRLAPWSIEDISRNALERQSENFKKANAFVSERNLFNFNRRISFHIPSPSFAVAR